MGYLNDKLAIRRSRSNWVVRQTNYSGSGKTKKGTKYNKYDDRNSNATYYVSGDKIIGHRKNGKFYKWKKPANANTYKF